jgi:hypothetical protein
MKSRRNIEIKQLVRILAGLVFTAVLLLVIIEPVVAKGPESATITGPEIDQSIELINNTDLDLVVRLMEQTGLWYDTGIPLPSEEPVGELGPTYTLTWINSGPPSLSKEKRTIRQELYLDAENGPLIHTPAQETLQGWGPGVIGWFVAPGELKETLTELGVPISPSSLILEAHHFKSAGDTMLPVREPAGIPWYLGVIGFALFVGLVGVFGAHLMKGRIGTS